MFRRFIQIFLTLFPLFTFGCTSARNAATCERVTDFTSKIRRISRLDWSAITEPAARELWPGETLKRLSPPAADRTCDDVLVGSTPEIAAECRCCVTFVFGARLQDAGGCDRYLKSVVIQRRQNSYAEARNFADAMIDALTDEKGDRFSEKAGEGLSQFRWSAHRTGAPAVAEVALASLQNEWQVTVSISGAGHK